LKRKKKINGRVLKTHETREYTTMGEREKRLSGRYIKLCSNARRNKDDKKRYGKKRIAD